MHTQARELQNYLNLFKQQLDELKSSDPSVLDSFAADALQGLVQD